MGREGFFFDTDKSPELDPDFQRDAPNSFAEMVRAKSPEIFRPRMKLPRPGLVFDPSKKSPELADRTGEAAAMDNREAVDDVRDTLDEVLDEQLKELDNG